MKAKQPFIEELRFGTASALIAAMGLIAAPSAIAQDQDTDDDEESEEVEEVVITGSRLARSGEDLAIPLVTLNRETILDRQFTNILEALNESPFFFNNTSNAGTQVQNGDSFSFPNILGLGTQRTLTLINGRRTVASNPNTVFVPGNDTGAQVDVTSIPPTLLERQEVVLGTTAGSVYGADAVAGAVNFIIRDDYEGITARTLFGISELGDAETYQAELTYGQNFDDGRGNFAVSVQYNREEPLAQTDRSFFSSGRVEITNPLNGNLRNPDPFNVQQAATILAGGGSLPSAFLSSGSDGLFSTIDIENSVNPTVTFGGQLAGGTGSFSGNLQPIRNGLVPGSLAGAAADPAGFAFFAPSSLPSGVDPSAVIASLAPGASTTGLSGGQLSQLALALLQRNRPTPAEFFASSNLDPNLFLGTFGDTDAFPRIVNTDPATSALFPFIAVPLQFAPNGDLVPLVIGDRDPRFTDINNVIGGDGLPAGDPRLSNQLRAGIDRFNAFATGTYEVSDTFELFGDFSYSRIEFDSLDSSPTAQNFNGTSGQGSIRIFIDENPFVNQQALATLNQLQADGFNISEQNGSRFISIRRNLGDLYGGIDDSQTISDTIRGTLGARVDFEVLNRNWNSETVVAYGRTRSEIQGEQRRDIEYFLALDVVEDANGNAVCRQQTLDAPESIAVRNPGLAGVFNNAGLVPTQAQIDACVPLNVLGEGNISQEAINNIITRNELINTTEQVYVSQQFSGEVVELPAGWAQFLVQGEFRRESNNLRVDEFTELGLGENANTPPADGTTEFFEYGAELRVPLLGGDLTVPGIKFLEVSGAWRTVSRSSTTDNPLFQDILPDVDTVTNSIFSASVSWRPIDDLLIRGSWGQAVRSPSQTELFGALQFAFANANNSFPCDATAVGQGPNPDIRARNCQTLFDTLGITTPPQDFININVGETAGVVGNPFLANEQSESFSIGASYTPSWLDGFALQFDYLAVDIENQVGLTGPATTLLACFDSPDFPNADLNGSNPCNQFIFGEDRGDGVFIVPEDGLSQITGDPVLVGPQAGLPLNGQGPGQVAFSFFSNLNLASTELRQFNIRVRYDFDIASLFGDATGDYGNIQLRSSLSLPERFDVFADGTPNTLNPQVGDVIPAVQMTNRLRYRYDDFSVLFTHIFTDSTVTNVQTAPENFAEQQNDFVTPSFTRFNADFTYRVRENIQVRLSVNNVFNDRGFNINGLNNAGQFIQNSIGRFYRLGVTASF